MNRKRLDDAIEEIREYTSRYEEMRAELFIYDYVPIAFEEVRSGLKEPKFVVIGMNPSEPSKDGLKERETPEVWAHNEGGSNEGAAGNWAKEIEYYLGSKLVVTTELFFWNSAKSGEAFKARFGTSLWDSPHLEFCVKKNKILLEEYQPAAVIVTGIGNDRRIADMFNLTHIKTYPDDDNVRLVEHYHDGHRPWLITRHWTGARNHTTIRKDNIKRIIHNLLGSPISPLLAQIRKIEKSRGRRPTKKGIVQEILRKDVEEGVSLWVVAARIEADERI